MAVITAQMVKQLRDKTDAGMMACKKALTEADGDMDAAVDNLRKAGVAKAAKKAGRSANHGCVVACIDANVGGLAEVVCETDFVARNEKFKEYASGVASRIAEKLDANGDVSVAASEMEADNLVELIGVIGENMQVRRASRWTSDGALASYVHMGGKIGVLVDAGGEFDADVLNDVCMHIAAFSPRYISPDDIPADVIAKEKEIAAAQVVGKPANIIDKIVMGKLNKWYTETCLVRQPWVRDEKGKTCLAKIAPGLKVRRFLRWQIGEEL